MHNQTKPIKTGSDLPVECDSDANVVPDGPTDLSLQNLIGWTRTCDDGVEKLYKKYQFKNFLEALEFVNKLGQLAEEQGHHPELALGWGWVKVYWWTHSLGGLHQNDVIMAEKTDITSVG